MPYIQRGFRVKNAIIILVAITILSGIVTAHPGDPVQPEPEQELPQPTEELAGPSSGLIIVLSTTAGLIAFMAFDSSPKFKERRTELKLLSLITATGIAHLLLGVTDDLLLMGGLGSLALGALFIVRLKLMDGKEAYHLLTICGLMGGMIFGYFRLHGGIMMNGSVDWLGVFTKGAEILIILIIVRMFLQNPDSKLTKLVSRIRPKP